MLTINNTLEGYLKDVEILGNTVQDASNLADIRSVGDTVEGQELYEIPVLSRGKNLAKDISDAKINDNDKHWTVIDNGDGSYKVSGDGSGDNGFALKLNVEVTPNTTYTFSFKVNGVYPASRTPIYVYKGFNTLWDSNKSFHSGSIYTFTTPSDTNKICLGFHYKSTADTTSVIISDIQLEEGTVATPYEPYQEEKLTILSPVQLEKVGDVRDRIICKDGVWGVEKNIGEIVLNGSEEWGKSSTNDSRVIFTTTHTDSVSQSQLISNKFINSSSDAVEGIRKGGNGFALVIETTTIGGDTIILLKDYLKKNNVLVKFISVVPQFIPLPHSQQIKLRTFANKTNISFLTEIEGTIKAQVPKSLGATVNTHTEQISNLNKELDRVKRLEESTVSTVTTESDFTTVEATSGGYFEDVKLEGKTLVNLVKTTTITLSNTNSANRIQNVPCIRKLEKGKVYTLFAKCTDYSLNGVNGVKFGNWGLSGGTINDATICKGVGGVVYKFTIKENATTTLVQVFVDDDNTEGSATLTDFVILEGDHTQNPPSYFEGLKSVGDGADEIVVSSVKEKIQFEQGTLANANGEPVANANRIRSIDFINGKDFEIGNVDLTKLYVLFMGYDENKTYIYSSGWCKDTKPPTEYPYVKVVLKINDNTPITPDILKSPVYVVGRNTDKKRLLYYNDETQAWEKPVLRQWDSVEKHSNGKYYYHQRSGEVVLNGSEEWRVKNPLREDILSFEKTHNIIKSMGSKLISDRFVDNWGQSTEGIRYDGYSISIHILKDKLLVQDISGFKSWLQANNVTVVYQLAQEKVYECTNIDLITYANETNYIVESGAIVPRTTLKVHNNISNVVSLLQKKVSLLEDKFIQGLKQVLAGDMYSLAELLYPEDFEEVETENNIMLLPLE